MSIRTLITVHRHTLKGLALTLGVGIGVSMALALAVSYLETGSLIQSVDARWVRKPLP